MVVVTLKPLPLKLPAVMTKPDAPVMLNASLRETTFELDEPLTIKDAIDLPDDAIVDDVIPTVVIDKPV
jgi:hypothetical protein